MKKINFIFLIFISIIKNIFSYPEQGQWNYDFNGNRTHYQTVVVTKSMFPQSYVISSILCNSADETGSLSLNVTWYLRKAFCWKEYYESGPVAASPQNLEYELEQIFEDEASVYIKNSETITCDGHLHYLSPVTTSLLSESDRVAAEKAATEKQKLLSEDAQKDLPKALTRRRRQNENLTSVQTRILTSRDGSAKKEPIYTVPVDGIYQFIIGTIPSEGTATNISYSSKLHIEMLDDSGYLSAADYPLLIFYSTMCVIYVVYGVCWLIVSFMRWRELLRVQYWIGAVILLGMLEKAVFTAEYESINKKGMSVPGLIVFAELVSCAKRTLSRMLVIIVSFGFGIVKPRLGIVLHRVIGVGMLYFLLASIEGCMRALRPKIPNDEYQRRLLFAIIPLALLESAICWWVFSALVSTTRTLRLRRNTVKLDLFRHFTNTLVFAVATSVIFMLWSIKYKNFDECLSDWKQLWVNDAFWHVLFAIILLVIMILWRPTNNNQRFAFSPLLDEGSDGDFEEQEKLMMSNASDSMKYRNARNSNSSSPRASTNSVEDDLRWVEENIPSAMSDTGLPVLDSDEEILNTKFEISKMQ